MWNGNEYFTIKDVQIEKRHAFIFNISWSLTAYSSSDETVGKRTCRTHVTLIEGKLVSFHKTRFVIITYTLGCSRPQSSAESFLTSSNSSLLNALQHFNRNYHIKILKWCSKARWQLCLKKNLLRRRPAIHCESLKSYLWSAASI